MSLHLLVPILLTTRGSKSRSINILNVRSIGEPAQSRRSTSSKNFSRRRRRRDSRHILMHKLRDLIRRFLRKLLKLLERARRFTRSFLVQKGQKQNQQGVPKGDYLMKRISLLRLPLMRRRAIRNFWMLKRKAFQRSQVSRKNIIS